ncbi:MAG TPA: GNAT family N-acetyltransferase [Polyangiales bacterium]|nr:GNAT family N-acetyltransferase [Polyangiales bacterium]
MRVHLVSASIDYEKAFLAAVRRSRELHGRWVSPPRTRADFRRYLSSKQTDQNASYFVLTPERELAGVINLTEMVLGAFRNGYLGYYAFSPYAGQGYMALGLRAVVQHAFGEHGLHRLEANIQPQNRPSLALVQRLGFRKEGFSPRYLKIRGRWRDHERWALLREEWPALQRHAPI